MLKSVVAIGASAGGLRPVSNLLASLESLNDTALIVAQHSSPKHESLLPQLLSKSTRTPVEMAMDGASLLPGRIYIVPPGFHCEVVRSHLLLTTDIQIGPRPSIDRLFDSLAIHEGFLVVGIVLSGTGTDGTETIATRRGLDSALRCIGTGAGIVLTGFDLLQAVGQVIDRSTDAAIAAELPGGRRLGGAPDGAERLGDCARVRCIGRFQGLGIDRQRSILLDADPGVAECRCIVGNDTFQLTGTNAGTRAFRRGNGTSGPVARGTCQCSTFSIECLREGFCRFSGVGGR